MMSTICSYTLQPQPPSHPKTSGRQKTPTAKQVTSTDEDTGLDSDHNPKSLVRLTVHGISSPRIKIKPNITSVLHFSNLYGTVIVKNPGLDTLHSSQTLITNNYSAVNSKRVLNSTNLNNVSVTSTVQIPRSNSIHGKNNFACQADENTLQNLTANNQLNSTGSVESLAPCSTSQSTYNHLNISNIINVDTVSVNTTLSDAKIGKGNIIDACDQTTRSATSQIDHSFVSLSNFAYEHDHDYESVSSPCSSTSSGPVYIRPPGFTHHAQEIEVTNIKKKLKKKYPTSLEAVREGSKKREATPPKLKTRREPLPMKLRALPQSFWEQPNVAHQVSPATLFLPPLLNKESEDVMMDVRPVTPPEERDVSNRFDEPERKLIVTNTDLLFKLFDGIGERKKVPNSARCRSLKVRKPIPKGNAKGMLLGNDPCMVDAVTENIFPQLTLESSHHCSIGGNTSLQLITLKEGDKSVTLPSLNLEQSYPQMLSELVLHI